MPRITYVVGLSLLVGGCAQPAPDAGRSAAPLTVCAAGSTTPGVDVSQWQGAVDWAAVKAAGKQFAIVRVTDGTVLDSRFASNWANTRAAGLVRGAYHFFRPAQDATQQAASVVSNVGALGRGDLPIVIDLEVTEGQSADVIRAALRTFIDAVAEGTGKQPIIMTAPSYWGSLGAGSELGSQPLWIMHWGVTCPNVPAPWSTWTFWMHSATGTVDGISGDADLDVFNGDLAALEAFAALSTGDAGTDTRDLEAGAADAPLADTAGSDTGVPDGGAPDVPVTDAGAADLVHPETPPADLPLTNDGGTTDAGRDTADEGKSGGSSGGCGCATGASVSPSLLALAAAALMLVSRRRRCG